MLLVYMEPYLGKLYFGVIDNRLNPPPLSGHSVISPLLLIIEVIPKSLLITPYVGRIKHSSKKHPNSFCNLSVLEALDPRGTAATGDHCNGRFLNAGITLLVYGIRMAIRKQIFSVYQRLVKVPTVSAVNLTSHHEGLCSGCGACGVGSGEAS
jgi:hypothetical protein